MAVDLLQLFFYIFFLLGLISPFLRMTLLRFMNTYSGSCTVPSTCHWRAKLRVQPWLHGYSDLELCFPHLAGLMLL
jgi:hypothetical protein